MKPDNQLSTSATAVPADLSPLVTKPEAARLCRVSLPTWERLERKGDVPPPVVIGRRRFYRRADVLAWINGKVVIAGQRGETVAPAAA